MKTKLRWLVKTGQTVSLQSLPPVIHAGNGTTTKGFCLMHGPQCQLKKSNIHAAGPVCTPWAPNGAREGASDSKVMIVFAAWASITLQLERDVLLVENSDRFPESIMKQLFGHEYAVRPLKLSGLDFGLPARRRRFFGLVLHLKFVSQVFFSMDSVILLWYRSVRMSYKTFLISGVDPEFQVRSCRLPIDRCKHTSKCPLQCDDNEPNDIPIGWSGRVHTSRFETCRNSRSLAFATDAFEQDLRRVTVDAFLSMAFQQRLGWAAG